MGWKGLERVVVYSMNYIKRDLMTKISSDPAPF